MNDRDEGVERVPERKRKEMMESLMQTHVLSHPGRCRPLRVGKVEGEW
jgi:hypothetical protein